MKATACDRRHTLVASGAVVLPFDITFGGVWTLRSGRPFTASAGVDLDGNRNNDYVTGTKKGDGNRMDMAEFLGLINTFRRAAVWRRFRSRRSRATNTSGLTCV